MAISQESQGWVTRHNTAPRGECGVCLDGFGEGKRAFMKTPCYHHLHTACFSAYARAEAQRALEDDNVLVQQHEIPASNGTCAL